MRTKRLWIGSLSITLILSLMCSLLLLFPSQRVQAETSIEDKCAQYTSTDLLKNTSSGKDIFDFASELNIAAYGAPIRDLPNVIPIEYLRLNGEPVVYKYVGEEYGFLVVHSYHNVPPNNGEIAFLHIFVFDFQWTFEGNRQVMRVTPIVSENFKYGLNAEGVETWYKSDAKYTYQLGGSTTTLYFDKDFQLRNVGFSTLLLNENAVNYGERGYSKQKDDGLIIQQTLFNFKGVKQFSGNGLEELGIFALNQALGRIPIVGDVITTSKDFCEVIDAFITDTKDIDFTTPEDKFIFTEASRSQQAADDSYETFTRASSINPANDIYIDVGGYAECVTLLSDTNYRSRLLEQMRFDIVSVKADKITYYNDNYDNGNRKPFLTTYSQSLFSEAAPVTEMDNKPMETSADIYLLENGNQKFSYTPYASGNYQIYDINKVLNIKVMDQSGSTLWTGIGNASVQLSKGKKYTIIVSGQNAVRSSLHIKFTPIAFNNGTKNITLNGGEAVYFSVDLNNRNYLVDTFDKNFEVNLYGDSFDNLLEVYKNGNEFCFYNDGHHKSVVLEIVNRDSNKVQNAKIILGDGLAVELDKPVETTIETKIIFSFTAPVTGLYYIEKYNIDLYSYFIDLNQLVVGNGIDSYLMEGGKTYYGVIKANKIGSVKFSVQRDSQKLKTIGTTSITGKSTYQFVSFTSKVSHRYTFSLSSGAQLYYLIHNGQYISIMNPSSYSLFIPNGDTVYFSISNPKIINFNITVDLQEDALILNQSTSFTLNENGTKMFQVSLPLTGKYFIESELNYSLLDSGLNEIYYTPNDKIISGVYYVLVTGEKNQSSTIKMSNIVPEMAIMESKMISNTSYYQYNLIQGEKYIFYTFGNELKTNPRSVEISDANGTVLAHSNEKFVSLNFTATTSKIYVKLIIEGKNFYLGFNMIFEDSSKNPENEVTVFDKNELSNIPIKSNNDYTFIKIPKGDYVLYVDSPLVGKVEFWSITGTGFRKYTDYSDSAAWIKYNFDSNEDKLYAVNGKSISSVKAALIDASQDFDIRIQSKDGNVVDDLIRGNAYTFLLVDENNIVIGGIEEYPQFIVNYNGETVVPINGYYYFFEGNASTVTVNVSFLDKVVPFAIFYVQSPEVEVRLEYVSDEYAFFAKSNMTYNSDETFKCTNNELFVNDGSIKDVSDSRSSLSVSLNDIRWEVNATITARYTFTSETLGTFIVEEELNYQNPRMSINQINFNSKMMAYVNYASTDSTQVVTTITVPSNIKMLNIDGVGGKYFRLNIKVASRQDSLRINVSNLYFYYADCALNYSGDQTIYFDVANVCNIMPSANSVNTAIAVNKLILAGKSLKVTAASAQNATTGNDAVSGATALVAQTLVIYINELYLTGGNGGNGGKALNSAAAGKNGGNAGNGGLALSIPQAASIQVKSSCSKIVLTGGNGGHGGNGGDGANGNASSVHGKKGGNGGAGGNGAEPCNYFLSNSKITKSKGASGVGGIGGNGGNGYGENAVGGTGGIGGFSENGTGGRGGDGGNGGDGKPINSSDSSSGAGGTGGRGGYSTNGRGGRGGDGGKGGRGGNGGNGGAGGSSESGYGGIGGNGGDGGDGFDDTNTDQKPSRGGNGGNGGKGGYSGKTGLYATPGNGGNGGRGGYVGNIGGGKSGGNGGYGYNGGHGGHATKGNAIFAAGGNGGNGGDAYGGSPGKKGDSASGGPMGAHGKEGTDGVNKGSYQNYPG